MSKSIKIPFPFEKFEEYKNRLGIKEEVVGTDVDQLKKLFALVVRDFKKGKVSVDELSSISEKLFNLLIKNKKLRKDEDFFFALEVGAELSFYVRHPESKNLNRFLKEVLDFETS